MKIRYDFHVHSALSPCADNDMTPCNIVGFAKLNDIDAVAIADHNAIGNVKTAMEVGEAYGVTVVPAMELQTQEDIHVLCLFETFEGLQSFHDQISFADIQNNSKIFGDQLLLDCDDQVVGEECRLLLIGANIAVEDVPNLAKQCGGIAIAAHIDREENGMLNVLGDVVEPYRAVEVSSSCPVQVAQKYASYVCITNSDAHTLLDIGKAEGVMEVEQNTVQGIIAALKK